MSLTGIVIDVSRSMESNIGSGTDEYGGPWARSIFKVIDDLIEHDVSSDDQVFAIGVGADCSKKIFDIIGTIQQIETIKTPRFSKNQPATEDHINKIFDILEINGARNIRNWGRVEIIQDIVSDYMAALILMKLESDKHFLSKFVNEFLPSACRDQAPTATTRSIAVTVAVPLIAMICAPPVAIVSGISVVLAGVLTPQIENTLSAKVSNFRPATTEDIFKIVDKAKCYFLKDVDVTHSIFKVNDASRIIRGCIDENELTTERSQKLLEYVQPFIYGRTPLNESLDMASNLFLKCKDLEITKMLLFVLSDGDPDDGGTDEVDKNNSQLFSELKEKGLNVVSCFITKSTHIEPKRLYDQMGENWERGAKFLFPLASVWPTQHLPRLMLLKRGWFIDIANNETKLFVQVNHPDNLEDACDLAQNVVLSSEALSDLLVSIAVDKYIYQSTKSLKARDQGKEKTCYAYACAAVLHMAMRRILCREGGYPKFEELKKEMIDSFGNDGAIVYDVLKKICPKYRLRCKEVDSRRAMKAIVEKRPVVATFTLSCCACYPNQIDVIEKFKKYYERNKEAILTNWKKEIGQPCSKAPVLRHAVVLTSFDRKRLKLMNSWGEKFGEMGFFSVKNARVLPNMHFFDVYWEESDLTQGEREYYRKYGSVVTKKLMSSLIGLQKQKYPCPKCNEESLVTDFTGTLSEVKCPKCSQTFSTNDSKGNILALNVYLTSLST